MPGAGTAAATHPVCLPEQRQLRPQPHGSKRQGDRWHRHCFLREPQICCSKESAWLGPLSGCQGILREFPLFGPAAPLNQPPHCSLSSHRLPLENHRKSLISLLIPLWRLSAGKRKIPNQTKNLAIFHHVHACEFSPWQRCWFAQPLFLSLTKEIKDREQREIWVRKGGKHHPSAGNMIQVLKNRILLIKGTKLVTTVFFHSCERQLWHKEKKWDLEVLFVIKFKAWSNCETNKEKTNLSADL